MQKIQCRHVSLYTHHVAILFLFDDFETGKISAQRFINSLLPYLKPGTTPNKVVHAWNAMILDVPPEKLQLLESFRGKYPVYLLSNTNEPYSKTESKLSPNHVVVAVVIDCG